MRALVLLLIFLSLGTSAAEIPTGAFVLPSSGSIDPNVLNNPNCDGVVLGGDWVALEPTEGVYRFNVPVGGGQSFDQILAAAHAAKGGAGMPVRIAINTAPKNQPAWLTAKINADSYPAAGKFFTYKDGDTEATFPVFWEPTLLLRHALLVQAVADHLANDPLVKVVYVPFCNASTNDFNPGSIKTQVDGVPPSGSTPVSRWQSIIAVSSFATFQEALTYAGNYMFAAYRTAFPNAALTTSIGRIDNTTLNPGSAGNNGRNIYEDVLVAANTAAPGKVVAQKNNLNGGGVQAAPATGTQFGDLWQLQLLGIATAAQAVWAAYNDGACRTTSYGAYGAERMNAGVGSGCQGSTRMLKASVDTGKSYLIKWYEIYENDWKNLGSTNQDPDPGTVVDVIAYAHNQLYQAPTGTPTPTPPPASGKTLQSARKGLMTGP